MCIRDRAISGRVILKSLNTILLFSFIFTHYIVCKAIKITLDEAIGQTPHDLRPYRLLVSLLDKAEIGPVILDDILYEVFR